MYVYVYIFNCMYFTYTCFLGLLLMREIVNLILQDSFNSISICHHWHLLTKQSVQLNASLLPPSNGDDICSTFISFQES